MRKLIQKIFRKTSPKKQTDGLTQPQREAIVDLLNFCMYADRRLSLAEDKFIADTAESLDWDENTSFDYIEADSIAKARAALGNPEARVEFLKSASLRLSSMGARARAIALCAKLMATDGRSESEDTLLAEIRKHLS